MCFQDYVHHICSHTSLIEQECPSAASLSLPFFLKLSCPFYEIISRNPSSLCGKGSFYCAQTHDGQYLDRVYTTVATVQEEIQQIEQKVYGEGGLRDHGQGLGNAILKAGGSNEDCKNDEGVKAVLVTVMELRTKLQALRVEEERMLTTIEKAKRWFAGAQAKFCTGIAGPVALSRGTYTPPLQSGQPRPLASLQGGSSRTTGQYLPAGRSISGPKIQKKRGPPKRQSTSPEKEILLPTRRSSRVRARKTTYVDDESDPFSRTPSPGKSEAGDSTFSPDQFEKQLRKARSSNLADMIGDWKKRDDESKDSGVAQLSGRSVQGPGRDLTRKRVWYGGYGAPQKRSVPAAVEPSSKRVKISMPGSSVPEGDDSKYLAIETAEPAPASEKRAEQVQGEDEVPVLEEDDPGVALEGNSTLSEIDWNILEEGVFE